MLIQRGQTPRPNPPDPKAVTGVEHYVAVRARNDREEPPELRGAVFVQSPDGSKQMLRHSGETTPEGPDIPAHAVVDKEVLIYVDGIGQPIEEQYRQIAALLHGGQEVGANLDRPVIGVHEGSGKTGRDDVVRIGKNVGMTKALQSGLAPTSWVEKAAYKNDPSIKAVKDLLQQTLDAGLKVTMMAHSGGSAQAALALSLLSREQGGRFAPKIQENVRVLSLAGAASPQDYEKSGVAPKNLLYTGSRRDDVYRTFHNHIHPLAWHRNIPFLFGGLSVLLGIGIDRSTHAPDYIFAQHQGKDQNRLESFLSGSPGGRHELA